MTGRLKANIADVPWLSWSVFTFHMHQHCSRLREEMMTLQTSNWMYQGLGTREPTLGFSQKSPCRNVARNQNIFGKDLSFKPNVTHLLHTLGRLDSVKNIRCRCLWPEMYTSVITTISLCICMCRPYEQQKLLEASVKAHLVIQSVCALVFSLF